MVTLRSILCPVDFSHHSQDALRWALALAWRYGGRLTVLTAVEPLLAEAARVRFRLDLAKQETEPALHDFLNTVLPTGATWAPHISKDVRIGNPADVILEAAHREHADLIVMGTHGLGGFRKRVLGSTTERVLRRTNMPLLAVPRVDCQSVDLDVAGPRFNVTKIVIATDFSDASTAAAQWAADFAQHLAVPIVLAHVVMPVTVPAQWRSYVAEVDEERVRESRVRLDRLSSDLPATVRREAVVSIGRPAESIASLARECDAGLIAAGLMSQQGAHAPRPGSIAYRILCLAHVPMLVVPPHAKPGG